MPTDLHAPGNGARLVALRELFELRLLDLAETLDVGAPFLSKVEKGHKPLPEALMIRAAAKYELPISFFTIAPPAIDEGVQTFKKNARATVRDEKRVSRLHKEATRLFRTASEATNYRTLELPDLADDEFEDAERLAAAMRQAFGIQGDGPVLNAIRALERHGIGVIDALGDTAMERARQDHAGISMPHASATRPLVALVAELEGAEKRFTVMHELGHVLMDRDIAAPVLRRRDAVERRADRFARAMLLPAAEMKRSISPSLNLHGYLAIKAEFGVRVDMIVKRGEELGLIDQHRAKSLYIQRSSAGWGQHEPVEVADERPVLLRQSITKQFGPTPAAQAAAAVGTKTSWVERWAHLEPGTTTEQAAEVAPVFDLAARRSARLRSI